MDNQIKNKKRYSRPDFNIGEINFAKSKRSQVTFFIIAAIVIIALIILFILFRNSISIPGFKPSMPSIQDDLSTCTKKAVSDAVNIMLPQGGYIQPELFKMYKDNKISYLCYTQSYYLPCINQQPKYIEHLSAEIKKYIQPKIEDCFYKIEQDYRDKQYTVDSSQATFTVNLFPKQIRVDIDKKIEISKNDENKKYDKFSAKVDSPIYDLGVIANEIVNQESKFCYFEYLGFSILYPQFSVEKIDLNSDSKIYNIKDKYTGKELVFAVRSCALPAGL